METKAKKRFITTAKSKRTIERNLRELRKLIDTGTDEVEVRVAYEMETAVRWALEKTTAWPGLAQQAKDGAHVIRQRCCPRPNFTAD